MAAADNIVWTGGNIPLQTCYVKYTGDGKYVPDDSIVIPDDLKDNPCAGMEYEWLTLWGGFEDASQCLEDFEEESDDELQDIATLIDNSNLSDAQKNWTKAIYMKRFRNQTCPYGENLTIDKFIAGAM